MTDTDDTPSEGAKPRPSSLGDRVTAFLNENPSFLASFAAYARHLRDATGCSRIGCQTVIERVRYERWVQTKTDDFKVNNSYEPYLSRLVMHEYPDLDELFETRRAVLADEWLADRVAAQTAADSWSLFDLPEQRNGEDADDHG